MVWILLAALGVPVWLVVGVRNGALPIASAGGPMVDGEPGEITGLGPAPVVLSLTVDGGAEVELAGRSQDRDAIVGPYAGVLL